ncbi:MAG: hypothetical protein K6F15_03930 [Treponema sp.]|nr:hypothetical protein [Treponema sp.]
MFSSLKTRFIIAFGAFILCALFFVTFVSSRTIMNMAESFAGSQGMPVVEKAASVIDGDEFEAFLSVMDESDPYYEELRVKLDDLRESVGAAYLYTMARFGNTWKYIVDGGDPNDEENFSALGDEEDVSSWGEAPLITYRTGDAISAELEQQEGWGWTISTYKGIKNSKGQIVGMIGCDFEVEFLVKTMRTQILKLSMIGFFVVIAGCLIVFVLTSILFGEMKNVSNAMEDISSGKADLTRRIPETGGLEIKNLAANCNKVIQSLALLVANLQKEADVLSESGNQLYEKMTDSVSHINNAENSVSSIRSKIDAQNNKVNDISLAMDSVESEIDGLESQINNQQSAIQQSSSAIEQISANIQSMNTSVAHMSSEFDNLIKVSELGRETQKKVGEQVSVIAEQSANLNHANQSIAKIASQTNLLAMNAAIEAAHAGEFGKGFGVVADEIRSLAETSAKQSREIKELLGAVSNSIEGIVESSNASSQSFLAVGEQISRIDFLMKEVSNGMEEEKSAVDNILGNVKNLNIITDDIKKASSQMRGESTRLFGGIDDLKQISEETSLSSMEVSSKMNDMKSAAETAVSASQRNRSAADSVVEMITGFKV